MLAVAPSPFEIWAAANDYNTAPPCFLVLTAPMLTDRRRQCSTHGTPEPHASPACGK
jgi:hypothetical protein